MTDDDEEIGSHGQLLLRTMALEKDTNQNRDIHAGWLVCQMDLAASSLAGSLARGRTATVSMSKLDFLSPVRVGGEVSFFGALKQVGNSSLHIAIEVWTREHHQNTLRKVTEGTFVLVAIDEAGRIRSLPPGTGTSNAKRD